MQNPSRPQPAPAGVPAAEGAYICSEGAGEPHRDGLRLAHRPSPTGDKHSAEATNKAYGQPTFSNLERPAPDEVLMTHQMTQSRAIDPAVAQAQCPGLKKGTKRSESSI